MLKQEQTQKTLDKFISQVTAQSRANLTRQDRNVSRKLYNSIKGFAKVMPRSLEAYIEMEEHGKYLDAGVKGAKSTSKAPNSPFRFGSGTGKKGGLSTGVLNWVQRRRLQFKDRQTNRFLSYQQTARLISRSIYLTGTKPTNFFSKPFENAFKKLPDELIISYGLDVETFLKYIITTDGKKN